MNMAEVKHIDIESRLVRWGNWARVRRATMADGSPASSGSAASQLGALIDRRAAELGEVGGNWAQLPGDTREQEETEAAWRKVHPRFRKILKAWYIQRVSLPRLKGVAGAESLEHAKWLLWQAGLSISDILAKDAKKV